MSLTHFCGGAIDMRRDWQIDHVDPKWADGRDYQLVCGLDVVYNMAERDKSLNIQKSNRFLPWRDCRDEIGTDPINPGDLCLFLDPDTHEWVLEEFMSEWWFEKTRRFAGYSQKWQKPMSAEARVNIGAASKGRIPNAEARAKMSAVRKGKKKSEEHRAKIGAAHKGHQRGLGSRHSPETKAKMRAAAIGRKHTPEAKAKMKAAWAERLKRREFTE